MIASFTEGGWQFEELRKLLKRNENDPDLDHRSIHLVNPDDQLALDRAILGVICPHMESALAGTPMGLLPTRESRVRDAAEMVGMGAARELEFCVIDPKRPVGTPNQAPWFLRGRLLCALSEFRFTTEFYIALPVTLSLRRIVSLLKNPNFRACPPAMSYDEGRHLPPSYSVKFNGGTGLSAPFTWELAAEVTGDALREHLGIVQALYCLEQDYAAVNAFRAFVTQLEKVYEAT
jgi:hypothetical protein